MPLAQQYAVHAVRHEALSFDQANRIMGEPRPAVSSHVFERQLETYAAKTGKIT